MQTKNTAPTHVTHSSIPIFINNDSRIIILGSLPSVKTREVGFYYAHPRNKFFKVLSSIFNEEEPIGTEERKAFLYKHNIALYDVIEECDICGSSDSSIKNPVVVNLHDILTRYPNIKTIGVNGNKAKELFNRYLLKTANEFDVKIYYLPSTSPANAKMGIDELVKQYSFIK